MINDDLNEVKTAIQTYLALCENVIGSISSWRVNLFLGKILSHELPWCIRWRVTGVNKVLESHICKKYLADQMNFFEFESR